MDITSIIVCPHCHVELTPELKCEKCARQYSRKHGVYNLLESDLPVGQEIYKDENPESYDKLTNDYNALLNEETKAAIMKRETFVRGILENTSGMICDLATGAGNMLKNLLECTDGKENVNIVCTDIGVRNLTLTRLRLNGSRENISYIVTDGRNISLKDGTFDYVTTLYGFGNIPEGDRVSREIYRILKPGGKIIIEGGYIDKDSRSYELACSVGVERGMVEEYILSDLEKAGFVNVKSTVVAEAVWAENPYDLIPAAGDTQRYCVIEAEKPQ